MRHGTVAGVVWLVMSLLLAGCAGGAPATAAPATQTDSPEAGSAPPVSPDAPSGSDGGQRAACELLTVDEIAAAVGNPVDDGVGTTRSDCSWAGDPDSTSVSVLLLSVPASICESTLTSDPAQEAVDGLGVPAYWLWVAASGGVGTLSLCTPEDMATVTVSAGLEATPDEGAALAQARTLAGLVVDRL